MIKEDYLDEVESDAFEYLRYYKNDVKEAIEEDLLFASFRGGNGCDDISEHIADRDYSIQEAADVLEYCTNEETDSSMWIGRSGGIRGMMSACAMQSYINDVAEMVEELYDYIKDRYEVRFEVVKHGEVIESFDDEVKGEVLESFDDELDAEDYIGDKELMSVREVSNYSEIWQEFIDEHTEDTAEPVYVFDGVDHELYKIVEDGDEYLAYRLKDARVVESEYEFTFEDRAHASWDYKPYEDADVTDDPAVFFDDVKRWTPHKIRVF